MKLHGFGEDRDKWDANGLSDHFPKKQPLLEPRSTNIPELKPMPFTNSEHTRYDPDKPDEAQQSEQEQDTEMGESSGAGSTRRKRRDGRDESDETLLDDDQTTWKRITSFFLHKFDDINTYIVDHNVQMQFPLDSESITRFLTAMDTYNGKYPLFTIEPSTNNRVVILERVTDWEFIVRRPNDIIKELSVALNNLAELVSNWRNGFDEAKAKETIHYVTKKMALCNVVKCSFEELIKLNADVAARGAANTPMTNEEVLGKLKLWSAVYYDVFGFVQDKNKGETELCAEQLSQAAKAWYYLHDNLIQDLDRGKFIRFIAGAKYIVQMPLT